MAFQVLPYSKSEKGACCAKRMLCEPCENHPYKSKSCLAGCSNGRDACRGRSCMWRKDPLSKTVQFSISLWWAQLAWSYVFQHPLCNDLSRGSCSVQIQQCPLFASRGRLHTLGDCCAFTPRRQPAKLRHKTQCIYINTPPKFQQHLTKEQTENTPCWWLCTAKG